MKRHGGLGAPLFRAQFSSDTGSVAKTPWFKSGLSFKCTKCGNCCSGTKGTVRFLETEVDAMVAAVQAESVSAFLDKYARRQGRGAKTFYQLKQKRTADGFDCVFLDRKSLKGKAVCSLYDARPLQCRTWPFWPENVESRQTWEALKHGTKGGGCPGINKGPALPAADVMEQRDATTEWRLDVDKPWAKLK
ncbi:Aste57867_19637 [Aphanomyces stellatus]|uniref:Aste57867_19637 protein n=1 Tax=Aphanomyces stellatus TaxID=120398 RepID=A0A485LD38_9STRA|nr:hypothetical protein As57867_019572 [Aphanomyces stellatus]VFT96337.1 Aste57867_19637 [Aphanomyces stellatus]